jgi:RimJ/RimL family protein N-acetyltransferase
MPALPPFSQRQREDTYDFVAGDRHHLLLEIRARENQRCVGEAAWAGITWPSASAHLVMDIYDPADRGRGYGSEAVALMCAYAFDILGLHRLTLSALILNGPVIAIAKRIAAKIGARTVGIEREAIWAFGGHRDMLILELLDRDFPPHPSTAALRALGASRSAPPDLQVE